MYDSWDLLEETNMIRKVLRGFLLVGVLVLGIGAVALPAAAAQMLDCCECKPDPADPNQTLCACGRNIGAPPGCSTCLRLCAYV
jgi:hypothetical protein